MLKVLAHIAAPPVLLLALLLLTGAVETAASVAGESLPDHCCSRDAGEEAPAPGSAGESECADPACGCLSCLASLHTQGVRIPGSMDGRPPSWGIISQSIPAVPGLSIDYPPESV